MSNDQDRNILHELIRRNGISFVQNEIQALNELGNELTIISNVGLHPIPHEYVRGEVFIASEGNLDFSSVVSVNAELDKIVNRLKEVLFAKRWSSIYLLPFGHSCISLTIKMTVFRLLRIETIDIFYFGHGKYGYLDRDSRAAILGIAGSSNNEAS